MGVGRFDPHCNTQKRDRTVTQTQSADEVRERIASDAALTGTRWERDGSPCTAVEGVQEQQEGDVTAVDTRTQQADDVATPRLFFDSPFNLPVDGPRPSR